MAQVFLRIALGFILLGALAPTASRFLLAGEAVFSEVCSVEGLHLRAADGQEAPAVWSGHDCPYCLAPNLAAGLVPGIAALLPLLLIVFLLCRPPHHAVLHAAQPRRAHPVRAPPLLPA